MSAIGPQPCSPIIDLRQYTLYPGTRDAFVALFDNEFVETQEAVGMRVIGQFRDLGDPNRFVWMRGFPDMPSRENALTSFYMQGDAWKAHGETARAMMIDSSDALLLHPVRTAGAFMLPDPGQRPALDSAMPQGIIVATICSLDAPMDSAFLDFFDGEVRGVLRDAGASFLGDFATEHSPNNFPRLPVRAGENIFVSFCGFRDLVAYHQHMTVLGRHPSWRTKVYPSLVSRLRGRPQILRLAPTSRSQLRAA
ncbi:MAG TPA: NIPSNAP family protein [Vineibacter sp.]|nr:NIPSNAP family protein [Vineibacter sp.]